jgi:hypothetical protein
MASREGAFTLLTPPKVARVSMGKLQARSFDTGRRLTPQHAAPHPTTHE